MPKLIHLLCSLHVHYRGSLLQAFLSPLTLFLLSAFYALSCFWFEAGLSKYMIFFFSIIQICQEGFMNMYYGVVSSEFY